MKGGGHVTASPLGYFDSSPDVIRLIMIRRTKTLQNFASVHVNVHNYFNLECHLVNRQPYKERRSAALAEWNKIAS